MSGDGPRGPYTGAIVILSVLFTHLWGSRKIKDSSLLSKVYLIYIFNMEAYNAFFFCTADHQGNGPCS